MTAYCVASPSFALFSHVWPRGTADPVFQWVATKKSPGQGIARRVGLGRHRAFQTPHQERLLVG